MSEHLSTNGIPHLVLERGRIAPSDGARSDGIRWSPMGLRGTIASQGWNTRTATPRRGPAQGGHRRLLRSLPEKISAQIRCDVNVTEVRRSDTRTGFLVETSPTSAIQANYVVAATGPFQRPVIPTIVPTDAGILQIHSSGYRNRASCPRGQCWWSAQDHRARRSLTNFCALDRRVYFSVGSHGRPPRSYRGRDCVWWLGVLNKWDEEAVRRFVAHDDRRQRLPGRADR